MAKIGSPFLPVRLGLLDHIEDGKLDAVRLSVWVYISLKCKANKDNGVVLISRKEVGETLSLTPHQVRRALEKLEVLGYIRQFIPTGGRGNYPVVINRYQVTRGEETGTVDAGLTTDYREPCITVRPGHAQVMPRSRPASAQVADDIAPDNSGGYGDSGGDGAEVMPRSRPASAQVTPSTCPANVRARRGESIEVRDEREGRTVGQPPKPQKQKKEASEAIPFKAIIEGYNRILGDNEEAPCWASHRVEAAVEHPALIAQIRARWNSKTGGSIEAFITAFERVARSTFLSKDMKRAKKPNLEFLTSPNKWAKLQNGDYDDRDSSDVQNRHQGPLEKWKARQEANHA